MKMESRATHHQAQEKPGEVNMKTGAEEATRKSRWMDWRCNPIPASTLGGWPGAFCTIVSAGCGYFAFSGIYSNLVLYLIRVWKESNVEAANDLTNLLGTLFFTTVIGAFLGDAYWGRLWTVVVFQFMFAVVSKRTEALQKCSEIHMGVVHIQPV